ncbi:MAG TPA: hypothetical protein VER17_20245 [Tepidisphaeraceae bacterium]|nr:hypothetical protein [Tepidisphaeraceae bacterium]
MHKVALSFIAVVSILLSLLGTLFWVTTFFAGMPNSRPEQIAFLRNMMIVFGIAGLACTVAAGWVAFSGHPWWGLLVGCVPFLSLLIVMVYVSLR